MSDVKGFSSRDAERIGKAVRKVEGIDVLKGNANGPYQFPQLFIRLVANDGTDLSKWSWQQVFRKADGTWNDGGLSGTLDDNPAYEINGEESEANRIVVMFRMPEVQTDSSVIMKWVFSDPQLPVPQYQYMVLQAVAQNVLGADFVRCHPLL